MVFFSLNWNKKRFATFFIKGQIATQPENFNNADLRKLSLKMANTPFLPDCHIIM